MTYKLPIIIVGFALFWVPAIGTCEGPTGNINLAFGILHTDDDFSKAFNMDKRVEMGANCDVKKRTWPVSIAFNYLLSYNNSRIKKNSHGLINNKSADVYCSEMYIGVKKIFECHSTIRPFICGGIYTVNIYVDMSYDEEFDSGIGGWAGMGTYVGLSKNLDIGMEWRWSKAEINVFDTRLNSGGNHFNLLIGYHF